MNEWQSMPKSRKAAGLVLLAGLLATGYAGYSVKLAIDSGVQRQFAADCQEIQLKIEARLQAHKQVLLGGAALFDAADSVSRDQWHAYAERVEIDQHFNGIQGLGFSLLIPKNRLARHIAEIRSQGFPGYTLRPAGERDIYSSIIYLEPFNERNLRAFGYDMHSEPVRRAAMEQARDENIISLSGKVELVQETDKDVQAGTLMYAPVYRKSMPLETVEQRRAALHGWVYSPFRMNDLLHGVLKGWGIAQSPYLRLQVYDGHGTNASSLLYHSEAGQKATSSAPALFTLEQHLNFNGREWTLHFEQLKGSASGTDYSKVWMILAGGTGLSILSLLLMLSYLNTRRNAERIAGELTAELRKASGYTRSLIEASLDPLVTISPAGKITDVNRATEMATGKSRAELIGTDFSDYFTEPDKAREGYRQVFSEGSVTDYPLAIRHQDGSIAQVLYNASLYHDEAGEVLGVFAAARDVTERNQAEAALVRHIRDLGERIKEAECLRDITALLLNKEIGVEQMLDTCARRIPAAWLDPAHTCARIRLGGQIYQTANFREAGWKLAAAISAPGTEQGLVEVFYFGEWDGHEESPFLDEERALIESIAIQISQLLEKRLAEAALRQSQSELREAQRIAHVGNWVLDIASNHVTWSEELYRMFGLNPDLPAPDYPEHHKLFTPESWERLSTALSRTQETGVPCELELEMVRNNGEHGWVLARAEALRDMSQAITGLHGVKMDITRRKQAEEEIRLLNSELEQRIAVRTAELEAANQELEAFSYSVSHDLRTPLRAIDGFSLMLLEDYASKLDDEGKRLLNVVRNNTSRMSHLIDDILRFSRAGRTGLVYSEIDMGGMVRGVIDELKPLSAGRRLQINLGSLPDVQGDQAMLHQVIENLLSNAIKFTGKCEAARIDIGGRIEDGQAVYYVKDNGAGFDMRYAGKLFGVFQRLHGVDEFEGTGIGLAITKRIIARHGGSIRAEGEVGKGATFYFSIPLNPEKSA